MANQDLYDNHEYFDKAYKNANDNIKAILFDITTSGQARAADIMSKYEKATDKRLKKQLLQLLQFHQATLTDILAISSQVTDKIKTLDDYERAYDVIRNKHMKRVIKRLKTQNDELMNGVQVAAIDANMSGKNNAMVAEAPQIIATVDVNDNQSQIVAEAPVIVEASDIVQNQKTTNGIVQNREVMQATENAQVNNVEVPIAPQVVANDIVTDDYALPTTVVNANGEEIDEPFMFEDKVVENGEDLQNVDGVGNVTTNANGEEIEEPFMFEDKVVENGEDLQNVDGVGNVTTNANGEEIEEPFMFEDKVVENGEDLQNVDGVGNVTTNANGEEIEEPFMFEDKVDENGEAVATEQITEDVVETKNEEQVTTTTNGEEEIEEPFMFEDKVDENGEAVATEQITEDVVETKNEEQVTTTNGEEEIEEPFMFEDKVDENGEVVATEQATEEVVSTEEKNEVVENKENTEESAPLIQIGTDEVKVETENKESTEESTPLIQIGTEEKKEDTVNNVVTEEVAPLIPTAADEVKVETENKESTEESTPLISMDVTFTSDNEVNTTSENVNTDVSTPLIPMDGIISTTNEEVKEEDVDATQLIAITPDVTENKEEDKKDETEDNAVLEIPGLNLVGDNSPLIAITNEENKTTDPIGTIRIAPVDGEVAPNFEIAPTIDLPGSEEIDSINMSATEVEVENKEEEQTDISVSETSLNGENIPTVTENKVVEFTKNSVALPKAIMTTKAQVTKLRASRDLHVEKFNSKFSAPVITDENLESQLISNGILPADENVDLEALTNQANELYKAGKLDEAQALFDKISEINSKNNSDQLTLKMTA